MGLHSLALLDLVDALVELGADASLVDGSNKTVLMFLATGSECNVHVTHFRRLVLRLVAGGANINAGHPLGGFTALGMMCTAAMLYGMGPLMPLLRAFVDAGADVLMPQPLPLLHMVLLQMAAGELECDGQRTAAIVRCGHSGFSAPPSLCRQPAAVPLRRLLHDPAGGPRVCYC